jgi:hypothetical protein
VSNVLDFEFRVMVSHLQLWLSAFKPLSDRIISYFPFIQCARAAAIVNLSLVFEMPDTRKDHGQAVLIRSGNHFFIAH